MSQLFSQLFQFFASVLTTSQFRLHAVRLVAAGLLIHHSCAGMDLPSSVAQHYQYILLYTYNTYFIVIAHWIGRKSTFARYYTFRVVLFCFYILYIMGIGAYNAIHETQFDIRHSSYVENQFNYLHLRGDTKIM